MLVDGFVSVEHMFLTVTNWGDVYPTLINMGKLNFNLKQWEQYVKAVLIPKYDKEMQGKYGFRRDHVIILAVKLKNEYEIKVSEL